jgi:hypothetical protein
MLFFLPSYLPPQISIRGFLQQLICCIVLTLGALFIDLYERGMHEKRIKIDASVKIEFISLRQKIA